jgi:2'-5' RNA ligase
VVRAFIAIELSESIQASIRQFQKQLQSALYEAPIRWVPVENIHLTLKFLGDIRLEQVKPLLRSMEEVTVGYPVFEFEIVGLGCFPSCKRPRVIWLGVEQTEDRLVQLHQSIDVTLIHMDFEPERKRFHPHLTLGRIKKSTRPDQLKSLARQLDEVEPFAGQVGCVESVHLIQSKLSRSGAEYTSLGSAPLNSKS